MLEKYKDVLSVKDLCEILPVGKSKVYELLRTNAIKNLKIGGKFIILKQNLVEFLSI